MISADLNTVLPEILLACGAMALLMVGAYGGAGTTRTISLLSLALLAVAALVSGTTDTSTAFEGSFINDAFTRFAKIPVLIATGIAIIMSQASMARDPNGLGRFEFPILMVIAALGMCLMVSANDLISLYMGLELQSLSLYVVAAFRRDSQRSSEAGLKYFVLGALASGMLLYGASLIYGFTGTTNFNVIASEIADGDVSVGLIFGLVFLTAGLAFKISAVPFHMWTPDVYEGAPTPATTFLASAPKIAAMALFARAVVVPFGSITDQWQQILTFIAIASMVLGAFAAIGQSNIKRLMAYSSIGHMGFALVGLAAGTEAGVKGVLVYLVAYVVMTLGTFACILSMRRTEGAVETIDDLAGLSQTRPHMALALAILMFSLAGIPPFGGFFAKFFVFAAAIDQGLYVLAVIGFLASVVGAFYYIRIVKLMYFDDPAEGFLPMPRELGAVLTASTLIITFFFLLLPVLLDSAGVAAKALFPVT